MLKNTVRRIALLASLPAALLSLAVTATATPANAALATPTSAEQQIIIYTNAQRAKVRCAPVHVNYQLTYAARAHSRDMAVRNYFSHTAPSGSNFVVRTRSAGYLSPLSENIGWGYPTTAKMLNAWMQSAGHRKNILNCSARAVGIGIAYKANGTPYYTQVFGRA